MQEVRTIAEDETLANSLSPMNKNWQSLLSNNSGVVFPVTNLEVGQACFRTDDMCLYLCADTSKKLWVKIANLTLTYVDKNYVDTMNIDISRILNLIDATTNKIKMSLIYSGTSAGQVVVVGSGNKIATSLIDTGTKAGKIVIVGDDGKIPIGILNVGVSEGQLPILTTGGKLADSYLSSNVAFFDSSGRLKFPNGNLLWVG